MSATQAGLAEAIAVALDENRCTVHGPVPAAAAADLVTGRALALAGGAPVAVATGDAAVAALDVAGRCRAAGASVLVPGDARWAAEVASAGVGVTGARLGVAATGSLLLEPGPGSPRAASLVPRTHLCVLRVEDVVASVADAVAVVAAGPLPSAVTWVGGPSRTGDLEMLTTFGVHGPVAVEVVLVAGIDPPASEAPGLQ